MKKILIFSHALELGGAERALLGLLYGLDYEKYQVDLFLMRHQGELLEYIPKQVNFVPEKAEYACLAVPVFEVLKKKQLKMLFGRIYGKWKANRFIKKNELPSDNGVELEYSHKYTVKYVPEISEQEYDLAISFLTPHYFVKEKVKAKKKIAWIHTDYSNIALDQKSELQMWEAYDYIVSISNACTEGFCEKFPTLRNKIIRIDNIISTELIKAQAEVLEISHEMLDDGCIKLLSVGRFCNAKNFDNVPDICKRICESGLKIKWYLIGFGPDEALIREKIKESGMESHVIILGKRSNPYPYMKACDLYVQPSRYEGNCVSVHEAQVLGKPVVITNYATAQSQLHHNEDGVIVPMDNAGCAEGIVEILRNPLKMVEIGEKSKNVNVSSSHEVEKIYALI